jgi:ubiquinone/menaquinone biosynthesis C-methylase UbiE
MFHSKGPTFFELAVQALSSTERGYDLLATKFDYTPFRTPKPVLDAALIRVQPHAPFHCALDLCCGTGAAIEAFRSLCLRRLVGIDFSKGMLAVARRNLANGSGQAKVEWVRGNVLNLPFAAEFDLVLCFGAHGHILRQDESHFVGEVARVLRPKGRFVFVTSFPPSTWSRTHWECRIFNASMRLRNSLISPPFIMYYLTFLLPEIKLLLEQHAFDVAVHPLAVDGPLARYQLVMASKQSVR